MKKIIIIAIATLSTGIVLSATIKNNETAELKQKSEIKKELAKTTNTASDRSVNTLATAD